MDGINGGGEVIETTIGLSVRVSGPIKRSHMFYIDMWKEHVPLYLFDACPCDDQRVKIWRISYPYGDEFYGFLIGVETDTTIEQAYTTIWSSRAYEIAAMIGKGEKDAALRA